MINTDSAILTYLQYFVFLYPFFMSLMWIAGSTLFFSTVEREKYIDFKKYDWPKISILIPCYNEEETIEETIKNIFNISYPIFDVIAVNDGSKDKTGDILIDLSSKYRGLKVIDCKENKGKANALHIAAHASNSEYFICIDSDAILDYDAAQYLIHHFIKSGDNVGAVTGNPRIRNRDTLLSKMQIVEYSSIIGSIKRTQRIFGKIMTVSGVIVAFRKEALIDVGLWDRDMITEDIAISWKLQKNLWDIRYEPKALCWMLVPESIKGIWKQRVRWSQGGQEALIRHFDIFKSYKQKGLWPIYIEQVVSIIWAFAWFFTTIVLVIRAETVKNLLIWLTFNSFALILLSQIQLIVSLIHDSKYDNILKYYFWAPWYPAIYWMINAFVVIVATPKAIISRFRGGYATWNSPDRGKIMKN